MENGIVTEGCDLVDTESTITAVGGSGGQLWTVGVNAQSFAPQNITISTGDTIRWKPLTNTGPMQQGTESHTMLCQTTHYSLLE